MPVTLSLLKVLIMVVIFSIVIITGNIPFRYKNFQEKSTYISYATAFTGGVFMSVALIHLSYAASLNFQHYFQQGQFKDQTYHYPFQQLLIVIGFSLILFLEKLIGEHTEHSSFEQLYSQNMQLQQSREIISDRNNKSLSIVKKVINPNISISSKTDLNIQVHSHLNQQINNQSRNKLLYAKELKFQKNPNTLNDFFQQDKSINIVTPQTRLTDVNQNNNSLTSTNIYNKGVIHQINNNQMQNVQSSLTCQNFKGKNQQLQILPNEVNTQAQEKINQNAEILSFSNMKMVSSSFDKRARLLVSRQQLIIMKSQISNSLSIGAYILQVTFGIHSLLEGVAIGIQNSFRNTLILGSAVFAHKWAEGLLHGMALKHGNVNAKQAAIMVFISATMNPIGMVIGWVFSGSGDLFQGILLSISAGTFLYVATLEVLAEEFNYSQNKFWKLVFYLIGIGFISSLWFLEEH